MPAAGCGKLESGTVGHHLEDEMRIPSRWPGMWACAFLAVALVAPRVWAEEPRRVTLEEAIRTAAERSIASLQAADRVDAGKASVWQAAAQFLPDLRFSASGDRALGRTSDSMKTVKASLSSGLTLFDGLGNVNSLRAAQLGLDADRGTYARTRENVIFQAASDFLDVLMNHELVASAQENLDAQRQQLDMIQEFYNAGNRSLADLLQQQAAVAQAELQLLSTEQTEGVSKLQLFKTMGVEPTTGYDAVPLTLDPLNLESQPPDPNSALEAALAHRADLAGQRSQVAAASKRVWAARSGYWPALSISAGRSNGYSSPTTNGLFRGLRDSRPTLSAGLSFSAPIFDRLQTRTSVEQARIALRDERFGLEDLGRQVTLEVRQAQLAYETATKGLRAAEAQLQYATQALAATAERYRVGAATLVELAASRAQYASARTQRVQAGYNVVIAWLAIGYYRGDIDTAVGQLR
jgi:outer membrane protein